MHVYNSKSQGERAARCADAQELRNPFLSHETKSLTTPADSLISSWESEGELTERPRVWIWPGVSGLGWLLWGREQGCLEQGTPGPIHGLFPASPLHGRCSLTSAIVG